MFYFLLVTFTGIFSSVFTYPGEEQHETGTLVGDIQNWAVLIQNYIIQVNLLLFTLQLAYINI